MSRGKRSRPTPAMNVTPLVDVVLVLLIIFMVVLPRMEHGQEIELPDIENVDEEPEGRTDPIHVSLAANESLALEDQPFERDALLRELERLHREAPRRRVILSGDRGLRYDVVRTLFASCQAIGFPGVSLRVGQRTPAASEEEQR